MVGLRGRSYEEKLAELGMRTLENRRKRLDLVQTFNIIKGIDKVESTLMFTTAHSNNLIAWRSRTDLRNHFFSNRIVTLWNSIPTDLKDSRTLNIFKAGLEKLNI